MKKILFCCVILLFAFGCRKNSNTNNSSNKNAADVFPDKVGDTWVYLVNDTAVYEFNGQSNTVAQYKECRHCKKIFTDRWYKPC